MEAVQDAVVCQHRKGRLGHLWHNQNTTDCFLLLYALAKANEPSFGEMYISNRWIMKGEECKETYAAAVLRQARDQERHPQKAE